MATHVSYPMAKILLLASMLAKDRVISNNGRSFLKELALNHDPKLIQILSTFESQKGQNELFLEELFKAIDEEGEKLFSSITNNCSLETGKTISKDERDRLHCNDNKSLVYGEIEFSSFARVLRKISPLPGGNFYDLGSGTGKAILIARMMQDFGSCTGIELLEGLYRQSLNLIGHFDANYRHLLCISQPQAITALHGSILEKTVWATNGDVIFANSTCFDEELMHGIGDIAARLMKPGAFIVTFTRGLEIPSRFQVLEKKRHKMSWGPATVFIHRKLSTSGDPLSQYRLNLVPSDDQSDIYSDEEDLSHGAQLDDNDDDDEEDVMELVKRAARGAVVNYHDDDDEEEEEEEEEQPIAVRAQSNHQGTYPPPVPPRTKQMKVLLSPKHGPVLTSSSATTAAASYFASPPIQHYQQSSAAAKSASYNTSLLTSPHDTMLLKRKFVIPAAGQQQAQL